MRTPTHRSPTPPGELLMRQFLEPMNMTQRTLADGILVPYQRVNELVNGKRGITPATALRLGKFFGMSPEFWMNAQLVWELYWAQKTEASALKKIKKTKLPTNFE